MQKDRQRGATYVYEVMLASGGQISTASTWFLKAKTYYSTVWTVTGVATFRSHEGGDAHAADADAAADAICVFFVSLPLRPRVLRNRMREKVFQHLGGMRQAGRDV